MFPRTWILRGIEESIHRKQCGPAPQILQRALNWIRNVSPARVGSSMVEQRPFKALVVGSSPTQPSFFNIACVYIVRAVRGVCFQMRPTRHFLKASDSLENREVSF